MAWYRFDCSSFWVYPQRMVAHLRASNSSRVYADAATMSRISLHDNRVTNRILRNAAQTIFTPVFKYQSDRLR